MSRSTVSHPQPKRYGDPKKSGIKTPSPRSVVIKNHLFRIATIEIPRNTCKSTRRPKKIVDHSEAAAKQRRKRKSIKVPKVTQVAVFVALGRYCNPFAKDPQRHKHAICSKEKIAEDLEISVDTVRTACRALEIQGLIRPHPFKGFILALAKEDLEDDEGKNRSSLSEDDGGKNRSSLESKNRSYSGSDDPKNGSYNGMPLILNSSPQEGSEPSNDSFSSQSSLPSVASSFDEKEYPPAAAAAVAGGFAPRSTAAAEKEPSPSVDELLGTFLESQDERDDEQIPERSIPFRRKKSEGGYEFGFVLGGYRARDQNEKFKYRTFGVTSCYLGIKIGSHDHWIPWDSWEQMIKVACDSIEDIKDLQGADLSEREIPFLLALRIHMRAQERSENKQKPMGLPLVLKQAQDLSKLELDVQGPWTPNSKGLGFLKFVERDQEYDTVLDYCIRSLDHFGDLKKVDGEKIYRALRHHSLSLKRQSKRA